MNDFKFVAEKFDIQNTLQYRLSIQVNKDGFSVLICDEASKLLQLQHFQTGSINDSIEFAIPKLVWKHTLRLVRPCDWITWKFSGPCGSIPHPVAVGVLCPEKA